MPMPQTVCRTFLNNKQTRYTSTFHSLTGWVHYQPSQRANTKAHDDPMPVPGPAFLATLLPDVLLRPPPPLPPPLPLPLSNGA